MTNQPITEEELKSWEGFYSTPTEQPGGPPRCDEEDLMVLRLIAEVRRLREENNKLGNQLHHICIQGGVEGTYQDTVRLIALGRAVEGMPTRTRLSHSDYGWSYSSEFNAEKFIEGSGNTALEALQAAEAKEEG